jgi:sigma-E factor negative regulatory protein RseA
MHKISELMDGELPPRESKHQIGRLKTDQRLTESWDTYHLIRDTLRREGELGPGFARRVRASLEREPVLIAPHTRVSYRMVRYTLPMAAAVAGVAVVAWLALSGDAPLDTSQTLAQGTPTAAIAVVPASEQQAPLAASAGGWTTDYLVAHQEFSPRTAMQGVASYARTVSTDDVNRGR